MQASKACTYHISNGLIDMLAAVSKLDRREVWSTLADMTQVCFDRLEKKSGQNESWTRVEFPKTEIRMKIKVHRITKFYNSETRQYISLERPEFSANITFEPNTTEKFTSRQVEEFLVENILLEVESAN